MNVVTGSFKTKVKSSVDIRTLVFTIAVMSFVLVFLSMIQNIKCDDLLQYEDGATNVVSYAAQYGEKYLWMVGLVVFIVSRFVGNDNVKQKLTGVAIGVFVAWVLCIIMAENSSAVSGTFNTIKDKLIGSGTSGGSKTTK